jgi:hypothetical protein
MSVTEMFEELARMGVIAPAKSLRPLSMPTVLQTVPTFVTYGTPNAPIQMGTGNAGLDGRSSRHRDPTGFSD